MDGINKDLKIVQRLKINQLGFKLVIGLFFWISLSLFLHFRQVRVEVLELNSIAPRYIVAQVDFEFPDDEATIILKQKKMSDISSIYFINAKEIKQKRAYLEQHLIEHQKWKDLPFISYEIINDISEHFVKILMKARFTDASTLKKMKKYKIDISDYLAINIESKNDLHLPQGYLSILAKKLAFGLEGIPEDSLNFMSEYFAKNDYILRVDHLTESQIKNSIEKNIPHQYTKINAGELIIGYKEKVTSKHIAMIQAMKTALAKKINLFQPLTIIGNILMALIFIVLSILYLKIEQPKLLSCN